MNIFIETPQRAAERLERERRWRAECLSVPTDACRTVSVSPSERAVPSAALDLDEPEPYFVAGDAYQRERAYDRRRTRTRRVLRTVRLLALFVLVPVAAIAVFFGAYAATYIVRGATPEELAAALTEIVEHVGRLLRDALGAVSSMRLGFV